MTKSKLIDLLFKYQNRNITPEEIVMLKDLTDEEIDIVFNINNRSDVIGLLKNENFKSLPEETKSEILNTIKRLREGSIYLSFIIRAVTNKNIIESGNVLELIKLIVRSKGPNQIDQIIYIASNSIAISSSHVLEICKLIHRIERDKEILKIIAFAATDIQIIKSGNVLNVIKRLILAKTKEEALKSYYNYVNKYKDLTLLDALSKGHINKIDFWNMLLENPEEAVTLIVQISGSDEIKPNETITQNQLENSKKRQR